MRWITPTISAATPSVSYVALFVLIVAGCQSPAPTRTPIASDATEGTFALAPYEWEGVLVPYGHVTASNEYGDIRIRATADQHMVISGAIQRFSGDDYDISISAITTTDGLDFEVRAVNALQGTADPDTERGSNGRFDGRIDLAILLPQKASLDARTYDGLLELKSFKGPAKLNTISGRIEARTPAALQASTDSGSMRIRFLDTGWDQPAQLNTRSGEIRVTFAEDTDVIVDVHTRGEIFNGLGVAPENKPGRVTHVLGSSGGTVVVRSDTGNVALRRDGVK